MCRKLTKIGENRQIRWLAWGYPVWSGENHFFVLNGSLGHPGPIPTKSGAVEGEQNFLRM